MDLFIKNGWQRKIGGQQMGGCWKRVRRYLFHLNSGKITKITMSSLVACETPNLHVWSRCVAHRRFLILISLLAWLNNPFFFHRIKEFVDFRIVFDGHNCIGRRNVAQRIQIHIACSMARRDTLRTYARRLFISHFESSASEWKVNLVHFCRQQHTVNQSLTRHSHELLQNQLEIGTTIQLIAPQTIHA